ncbi:MAG TPA: phosphatase PAP2 family protein, partial [Thermodesulfobacteriota bacterium]|nr:phosphatase PAP2 family protein [Thermodesulfobacteriota bacterium]
MEPHRGARTLRTALIVIIALLVSSRLDFLTGNLPLYPPLTSLSRFFSFLGDGAFLIPLSVFLYLLGRSLDKGALKRAGAHSLFSIIASGAVVHILKAAFERPRVAHTAGHMIKLLENPTLFDLTGRYNSFPSGHSTVGFAVAFILGRTYPSLRLPLYAVAALIAASRVYLGSHYPSDVAAGAALGLGLGYVISNGKDLLKGNEKLLWAGILLLAVFVSFFKTGGFLLFDVDEAVFSEASREMLLTGDYLTPTYNFEPRYDKPILIYWFMSLSFALFGVTEFAARLPSSGFGVGLALVTFSFVRRFSGVKEAVFSTLVLLLNLEFFVYSHSAVTDMPLAFFISGSLFSFYAAVKTGERKFHALFWVSSALAVLTKGAIGLVFPLAISLVHLAATRDLAAAKRFLRPAYIILFLVVAVPWFAAEYHLRGWEFIDAFIIKHHIKRYTGVISSHSGPFYYYALILMAGLYPWVAFLPGAVYRGVLRRGGDENADLGLFLSIWFLLILVFFSAASTKLPNYILPLVPAASVLAGL